MKYIKALIAVVILVIIDQWTKSLAVLHLKNTDGISIVPGVFRLYYLENRGSAFGMLQNQRTLFVIITVIVLIAIALIYTRIPNNRKMLPIRGIAVLIYAGAIGNFIDRIRQSYVVDFFYFELIDFPIFNVADIYVTVSAFLFIFLVLFYYKDDDFSFINIKNKK